MDDDKIETEIKKILPSLNQDIVKALIQRLVELGVTDYSHLNLVEESDINDVVKTIQARLLIRSWKRKEIETNIVEKEISPQKQTTVLQIRENPSPKCTDNHNWAYNYEVPWESIDDDVMKPLEEGKCPAPGLRRRLIRDITNDIRKISQKPGRRVLSIIARKIVQKFKPSLGDILDDQSVGEEHESFLTQMENRFDNFNRFSPMNVFKRTMQENKEGEKKIKLTVSDAYGCVNWQPYHLPIHESDKTQVEKKLEMIKIASMKEGNPSRTKKLLQDTYFSQRKDINNKTNIIDLKREWPLLFKTEGMQLHFEMLMEFNIVKKLNDSLATKGFKVFKFLKSLAGKKEKGKKMQDFLDSSVVDAENPDLQTIMTLLSIYFKEDIKELFSAVDVTKTANEVESMELPSTPHLVCYGEDVMNASSYMILIDRKIAIDSACSFAEGFALMFMSFYCFNIHYPKEAAVTLEFVQRCFLGINPNRGSKVKPGQKKRGCVNQKILNMINRLSESEFIDC